MTERERLIELLKGGLMEHIGKSCNLAENLAAHLLDNGVIFEDNVVKTMHFIGETLEEKIKYKIEKIEYPVGKTIFAMVINGFIIPAIHEAIEEAEKALERREG
jgi:hypothetical protein